MSRLFGVSRSVPTDPVHGATAPAERHVTEFGRTLPLSVSLSTTFVRSSADTGSLHAMTAAPTRVRGVLMVAVGLAVSTVNDRLTTASLPAASESWTLRVYAPSAPSV